MARFVPNPAFKRQLQGEPRFRAGIDATAVLVAVAVEQAAQPFRDTGEYIRSIDTRGNKVLLERHVWHIVEYGSVNNPPQANVRRGVKAAGLRFEDSRTALT